MIMLVEMILEHNKQILIRGPPSYYHNWSKLLTIHYIPPKTHNIAMTRKKSKLPKIYKYVVLHVIVTCCVICTGQKLTDIEDIGSVLSSLKIANKKQNQKEKAKEEKEKQLPPMVSETLRKNLTKEGYKIIGSHSGKQKI